MSSFQDLRAVSIVPPDLPIVNTSGSSLLPQSQSQPQTPAQALVHSVALALVQAQVQAQALVQCVALVQAQVQAQVCYYAQTALYVFGLPPDIALVSAGPNNDLQFDGLNLAPAIQQDVLVQGGPDTLGDVPQAAVVEPVPSQNNHNRLPYRFCFALMLVILGYALYSKIFCAMHLRTTRTEDAQPVSFHPGELRGNPVVSAWDAGSPLEVLWFLLKQGDAEFNLECSREAKAVNGTRSHEFIVSSVKNCVSDFGRFSIFTNTTSPSLQLKVAIDRPCSIG